MEIELFTKPKGSYMICTVKNAGSTNVCPKSTGKIEQPAYLIKWSRFGNVSKYKWSKKNVSWIRQ